jgi:2'-5' RNA ligase
MALAVCLLLDRRSEQQVRGLWQRLEQAGVPSLASHTHGRHLPHLSLAVLRTYDADKVAAAVENLPSADVTALYFDALGLFRRGRCWLVPSVTAGLVRRQEAVVEAVRDTGADLHRHYEPGLWVPHFTIAPRVRLGSLPEVAALVYDVLPLQVLADRAALVDSSTGRVWPLQTIP